MKPSSSELAMAADGAYALIKPGVRGHGERETVILNGQEYAVREHVNSKVTGYQGTIYQRLDTGQVVVAHRGTEADKKDIATDAAMVAFRLNTQAPEAIALTARAMSLARSSHADYGAPGDVIVTGHSLGGALTQITAHHFDLKGETFNAYGAASLSRRIPEGGNSVVNHVMATDPVSAASPHYGEVRIYARQNEIDTLKAAGYESKLHPSNFLLSQPVRRLGAPAVSLESHKLGNFLGLDSVLEDPQSQARASLHREMIEDYRGDVKQIRQVMPFVMGSGLGVLMHAFDELRGPLPAGEPARREREEESRAKPAQEVPSGPLKPLNGPGHVGHPLFIGALRGVHELDRQAGRVPDMQSEQLAGALACRMHELGGKRIDHVVMSNDAATTFAVQGQLSDPAHLRASVPTVAAMSTPLEQSGRAIKAQALAQAAQQDQAQEQVRSAGRPMIG